MPGRSAIRVVRLENKSYRPCIHLLQVIQRVIPAPLQGFMRRPLPPFRSVKQTRRAGRNYNRGHVLKVCWTKRQHRTRIPRLQYAV